MPTIVFLAFGFELTYGAKLCQCASEQEAIMAEKKAGTGSPPFKSQGFREAPQAAFEADISRKPGFGLENRVRLTLGPGGRVVIPAALREAMEVEEGDAILAWVEEGELHLLSPRVGAKQAQVC